MVLLILRRKIEGYTPSVLADSAGVTADPNEWHVARSIFVADTDTEAEEFVKTSGGAYDYYYDYLFKIFDRSGFKGPFVTNQGDDPESLTPTAVRDACVIYGSPETVAKKIIDFKNSVGDFGTLLYAAHDWTDKAVSYTHLTLPTKA